MLFLPIFLLSFCSMEQRKQCFEESKVDAGTDFFNSIIYVSIQSPTSEPSSGWCRAGLGPISALLELAASYERRQT